VHDVLGLPDVTKTATTRPCAAHHEAMVSEADFVDLPVPFVMLPAQTRRSRPRSCLPTTSRSLSLMRLTGHVLDQQTRVAPMTKTSSINVATSEDVRLDVDGRRKEGAGRGARLDERLTFGQSFSSSMERGGKIDEARMRASPRRATTHSGRRGKSTT